MFGNDDENRTDDLVDTLKSAAEEVGMTWDGPHFEVPSALAHAKAAGVPVDDIPQTRRDEYQSHVPDRQYKFTDPTGDPGAIYATFLHDDPEVQDMESFEEALHSYGIDYETITISAESDEGLLTANITVYDGDVQGDVGHVAHSFRQATVSDNVITTMEELNGVIEEASRTDIGATFKSLSQRLRKYSRK